MSYSNPITQTVPLGAFLTTAAAVTINVVGPKGMQGRLREIFARSSAVNHVLGTTTPTKLQVGIAGSLERFAAFLPPAMTIPTATTLTNLPGASVLTTTVIAANEQVVVTTVANTGGVPTGTITYELLIDWF